MSLQIKGMVYNLVPCPPPCLNDVNQTANQKKNKFFDDDDYGSLKVIKIIKIIFKYSWTRIFIPVDYYYIRIQPEHKCVVFLLCFMNIVLETVLKN
jgi:hypothetical protein